MQRPSKPHGLAQYTVHARQSYPQYFLESQAKQIVAYVIKLFLFNHQCRGLKIVDFVAEKD